MLIVIILLFIIISLAISTAKLSRNVARTNFVLRLYLQLQINVPTAWVDFKALCIAFTETVPFTANVGAFTIADYGAADGGTSMFLIRDCIGKIRTHSGKLTEAISKQAS